MKSLQKSDVYTFEGVGFSYELPEDLIVERGSISKLDFGEISYGSGVMMGYPVYYDMTEEELSSLSDEDAVLSFETVDLDGNIVKSEDLFARSKVTMINIWGTHCGPCIMEMPEIEKMYQEYASQGGGVVGIVADVSIDNFQFLENALTIVKETGVTYTNLLAWKGYDKLLEHQGTPTTYFVDSKGKLIGSPVLGAQITVYPKEMEALLSEAE